MADRAATPRRPRRPPEQEGGGGYTFGDQVGLSTRYARRRRAGRSHAGEPGERAGAGHRQDVRGRPRSDRSRGPSEGDGDAAHRGSDGCVQDGGRPPEDGSGRRHQSDEGDRRPRRLVRIGPRTACRDVQSAARSETSRLAAVERFNERVRPGDAERSALLKQVRSVLNDEERDNFRAALERRPLVKAAFTVNLQRDVIVGSGRVDRPGVVR